MKVFIMQAKARLRDAYHWFIWQCNQATGERANARIKFFVQNQRGSIITYAALAVLPLAGFTGVALDTARAYMLQSQLTASLDASALAAGKALTEEEILADVNRYFDVNFKDGYMNAAVTGPFASYNSDTNTITVTASADMHTSFMHLFGQNIITVSSQTQIQRNVRGMELVLVMDNTGSMRSGSKMSTMKNAAADLINILYGERETVDDFWVGLVPFVASINIGADNWDWLSGYDPSDFTDEGTVWKGCVEARSGTHDRDDSTPSENPFTPYFYPDASDNNYPPIREENYYQNDGKGPNLGCGPAITPLTSSKTTIIEKIEEMLPWHRGGTMSNLGLSWGWRVLSPNWRGVWHTDDASLPKDYDEPLMDKVAIILTDGVNQFYDHGSSGPDGSDYTAYGRRHWNRLGLGSTSSGNSTNEINARMSTTCEAMKQEGIIIYTITFQLSNSSTQSLYRNCATSDAHYFNSPSNEELQLVFRRIGNELSNLRITQ